MQTCKHPVHNAALAILDEFSAKYQSKRTVRQECGTREANQCHIFEPVAE